MKITVNGEQRDITLASATVADILDALDVQPRRGIAVARNGRVVPRSEWETEPVEDGDAVEVVRATQGG